MTAAPEFSRPVRLDTLGGEPRAVAIEAGPEERATLAVRFGLLAIGRLEADATLTRDGETVDCVGRLSAVVTQACVASGEPVVATVNEPFALRFVPEAAAGDEEEVELGAADLDEIGYAGGAIDLGEAAAQTLALALDPFPRAPGADAVLRAAGVTDARAGPFAALRGLGRDGYG